MGGRGGGGIGGRGISSPSKSVEAQTFVEWAHGNDPIQVAYTGEPSPLVMLPDVDGRLYNDGGRYKLYTGSHDTLAFQGRSPSEVWHKVSAYYGGRVQVTIEEGNLGRAGTYGSESGRLTSPAAKKYGVS